MITVTHLLDQGIRPLRGKLTLSFANVEADRRFDAATPFDSRFVERDFNRLWDAATLDGPDQTADARRARALRPIYAEADALLDRSEEHTSELQSLMRNSYAVFCLKKKHNKKKSYRNTIYTSTKTRHQASQKPNS